MKILCIDDDQDYLALHRHALQSESGEDMQVFTTDNSNKAFEILTEHQIDILITDLYMPETSGLDVLKKQRRSAHLQK